MLKIIMTMVLFGEVHDDLLLNLWFRLFILFYLSLTLIVFRVLHGQFVWNYQNLFIEKKKSREKGPLDFFFLSCFYWALLLMLICISRDPFWTTNKQKRKEMILLFLYEEFPPTLRSINNHHIIKKQSLVWCEQTFRWR